MIQIQRIGLALLLGGAIWNEGYWDMGTIYKIVLMAQITFGLVIFIPDVGRGE